MFKQNKQILVTFKQQMNIIGHNIKKLRQRNRWSQGEVANRLKISIPAFSKIENGITDVNISRLNQIAMVFEISVLQLIAEELDQNVKIDYDQINHLKLKISDQQKEINVLQKRVIDLYEEVRNK